MVNQENQLVTIQVKLFAAYQEAYNVPELTLKFPHQTPVSRLQKISWMRGTIPL